MRKKILLFLFMHITIIFYAQIIPTTIQVNPSQIHTFSLEKDQMTLVNLTSAQNTSGTELFYYNGGAGSAYHFLVDYYRFKFTHTGIANSDITNVSYSFNYAAHNDVNHPTQPAYWSNSAMFVLIPPNACNANYWGSYSLSDCSSTENCINNGSTVLAYIGPNGNPSNITLTQNQSITNLSALLLNPNDFTIAFKPDGNVTCYIDLKSTITAQITYNTYPISNNIISGNQSYAGSANPTIITGAVPTGGNKNTFTYQWQSSLNNSTWTNISGATAASYDPPTISQTTYYRRIVNSAPQPASTSNVITVTITTPPPATPLNFTGNPYSTSSTTQISLSWSPSTGAASYDIFYCDGTFIANVAAPATSYVVNGLTAGNVYSFKITAKNAGGSSLASSCINVANNLAHVTGVTFTTNCDHLTMTWNPVNGANIYTILNCNGNWVVADVSTTSALIACTPGNTINYAVQAWNNSNGAHDWNPICTIYNVPVTSVSGGASSASSSQICPSIPSSLLSLTGYFGSIQWQSSVCGSAFQDVPGATASTYNVTSAAGTGTSFRAKVTCGSTIAYSNTQIISQYNICNPQPENIPICSGGGEASRIVSQTKLNNLNDDEIKIYPNPATNVISFKFSMPENSKIEISIYDIVGKEIYTHQNTVSTYNYEHNLDIRDFNRGVYFVKIKTGYSHYMKKIVLE